MLTPRQEEWLQHLSDEKTVTIVPFDPTAEEKFQKVKAQIQEALGKDVPVEHRGSTALGISGQDEIDIYIPVEPEQFSVLQPQLDKLFGEPRSNYPLIRVRFAVTVDGKKADVFLINKNHEDWLNGLAFEQHCREHPESLEAYRKLKENLNGKSSREFYRQKIEFINDILMRTQE